MNTPAIPSPKTEFTEVLTSPELIPSHPPSFITDYAPSTEEFPTVFTESSLISEPTSQRSNKLIKTYDELFPTLDQYQNFVDTKLAPWRLTRDFKYFNILYKQHRHTNETIKRIRRQALDLLNEANTLTQHYREGQKELDEYVLSLDNSEYQRQLFRPTKVYPKSSTPHQPTVLRQPIASSSNTRPSRPPYPHINTQTAPLSRRIRCFQCDSPQHIKWYCNQYRCRYCHRLAPGHSQKNCPNLPPIEDYQHGHYDIGGEEDGNLTGEC